MFNTSCWLEYCYSFYCHDRLLCTLRAFLRRWILSVVFSQIIYFGHLPTLIYEHYLSIISLDIRSGMISPVRFLPTTSDLIRSTTLFVRDFYLLESSSPNYRYI